MVICKFFLQGTCKFGDNCKFEHQINSDHSYTNNSSILVQTYANKPQANSTVDTSALVKAVVNDMTSAEKGGQWLLSSYAPFKEKPAFPGFEDHSMEEVRYLFYESVKNGTVEQYKQNLQMMLQQAMLKIKMLQNPIPEVINVLKNIYDTPPSSSLNNQSTFSATPQNSIFGGAQAQPVFASPPPNQNIFGGGGGAQQSVSPPPNQNIFGGGGGAPQSVFAGANANTIFGSQNSGNSVFATPPQTNQSKSIFGGAQPTGASSNSIFGAGSSNSIFGSTQQTVFNQQPTSPFGVNQQSVFAPQATATQPNIFQQNQFAVSPNNSQLGNTMNTNVQFNPPQNVSPFASPQSNPVIPQNSQFGTQIAPSATQNKPAFQHTQSIFGNLVTQPMNNVLGNIPAQKPNEEFYSKLEDLTEEEIKWFQSDDLDIMKIPEKPPTYEMCFKVQ